jgi:hypothetical protein
VGKKGCICSFLFVALLDWLVFFVFCFFCYFCLFFVTGSCYVTQACIKLKILLPPPLASASQMVELQVCTNTPNLELILLPLEVGNVVVSTRDVEMQLSFEKRDE